jgi:hypothetical protein
LMASLLSTSLGSPTQVLEIGFIPMFLLWTFLSLKSLGTQWKRYLIVEIARVSMH